MGRWKDRMVLVGVVELHRVPFETEAKREGQRLTGVGGRADGPVHATPEEKSRQGLIFGAKVEVVAVHIERQFHIFVCPNRHTTANRLLEYLLFELGGVVP